MNLELTILVGTQTGVAQLVAQEIELRLDGEDIRIKTLPMDDLDPSVFDGGGLFLICTSTYGQGDVPDNAMNLYNDLCAKKPDLKHVRYGVFSLGDRTYAETFNFGGKKFDKILEDCGAHRIGTIFTHDASAGTVPEDEGVKWVKDWAKLCAAARAEAA